ncbi:MAG TPA: hypothetical protein VF766_08085 [Pyrinomonadaceae bacterium]
MRASSRAELFERFLVLKALSAVLNRCLALLLKGLTPAFLNDKPLLPAHAAQGFLR